MTGKLQMFINRRHLGEIGFDGANDSYALAYDPAWFAAGGFAVSPHLKPGACRPESVRRFMANLLPEGKWLEELSVNAHISRSNIFGLVAAIGVETTGALSFRFGDTPEPEPTAFRGVTEKELAERISRRQEMSITLWDGKPRLSVAGVQEKLPLLIMPDGGMGFGEGDLASTHILKFGKTRDMHLVINEYVCMKLAQKLKLPVAEVSLSRFGEPVLVVKRFDRQWAGDKQINRLHLIDGCQMLDLPPSCKYERPFGKGGDAAVIRSGANLPALFSACRMCRIPAAATRDILKWVLFQLLIGNSDAHAKNVSFFVGPDGIDMAPAYDLLCLDMYGNTYDRDMAMAVGDTFNPDEIMPYQLAEMCAACKLPQRQAALTLAALCENLLRGLDDMDMRTELTDEENAFVMELTGRIRNNAVRFLSFAQELPRVKL